jgi:hypothetical protein
LVAGSTPCGGFKQLASAASGYVCPESLIRPHRRRGCRGLVGSWSTQTASGPGPISLIGRRLSPHAGTRGMILCRPSQGRGSHALQRDLRHIFGAVTGRPLERLIARTALDCHLHSRSSAQRFERDTYHGDALPTELRGRVLNCPTCGFAPLGDQLRSCTPVMQRRT